MNTCSKCRGDGLVGNGDVPHDKVGRVETCDQCAGTGQATNQPNQIIEPQQEEEKKGFIPEAIETVKEFVGL